MVELRSGLALSRSMSTVEQVAEASGRWAAHCQKVDTPAQNAIRQLKANTPGWHPPGLDCSTL